MTEQPYVARFSSGPWLVFDAGTKHEHETNYPKMYEVRSPGIGSITGWGSVRTTYENARLIAAAPELYEALLFIFEHISDENRSPRDLYPAFGLNSRRAIEMAQHALQKAVPHTVDGDRPREKNTDES